MFFLFLILFSFYIIISRVVSYYRYIYVIRFLSASEGVFQLNLIFSISFIGCVFLQQSLEFSRLLQISLRLLGVSLRASLGFLPNSLRASSKLIQGSFMTSRFLPRLLEGYFDIPGGRALLRLHEDFFKTPSGLIRASQRVFSRLLEGSFETTQRALLKLLFKPFSVGNVDWPLTLSLEISVLFYASYIVF